MVDIFLVLSKLFQEQYTYLYVQQHWNVEEICQHKNWYDIHCQVFTSCRSSYMNSVSMRRTNSKMPFKRQGYHHKYGSTHGYQRSVVSILPFKRYIVKYSCWIRY